MGVGKQTQQARSAIRKLPAHYRTPVVAGQAPTFPRSYFLLCLRITAWEVPPL
jgi:hypothetical protein